MSTFKEGDPTPNLEPVKKIRLSESIIHQITTLMGSGQLIPGQRLPPERELADRLGVSRTSIREALRSLEIVGLIESRVGVGGGTFIAEASLHNAILPFAKAMLQNEAIVGELLEVILLLEVEVARRAALHRTPEHIAEMKAAIQLMSDGIDRGETELDGTKRFRQALADASDNTVLNTFMNICSDLLYVKVEERKSNDWDSSIHTLGRLRDIYTAVSTGNAGEAQKLMRELRIETSGKIRAGISLQ
ncbi:MAG: FadR family transcriptional regulator [Spirochaetaceae bacterium]|nr:MAG: FadR family transcriptional regulator [Spirochaetaceae bacterium]